MSEKLLVVSVVDGRPSQPDVWAKVQCWAPDSLEDSLRRQRRELQADFLPVAAALVEPEQLKLAVGLLRLPTTMWLGHAAHWFGKTGIIVPAQGPIISHLRYLEGFGGFLFDRWEAAVKQFPAI